MDLALFLANNFLSLLDAMAIYILIGLFNFLNDELRSFLKD
mgnify:CR=1 FL=1